MKKFKVNLKFLLVLFCLIGACIGLAVSQSRNERLSKGKLVSNGFALAYDRASGGSRYDYGISRSKDSILDQPKNLTWLKMAGLLELANPIKFGDCARDWVAKKASPGVIDSDLKSIANLKSLVELRLDWNSITDDGLEHLSELHKLKHLYLDGCDISDKGLRHLSDLKNLETLSLKFTAISDVGVSQLGRLTNLTYLSLQGTDVSNRSLDWIASQRKLSGLNISDTKIDQSEVEKLQKLDQLKELYMSGLQVNDLSHILPKLRNLKFLDVNGTQIGDTTIKALDGAKLTGLCIENTRVTSMSFDQILKLGIEDYFEGYRSGLSLDQVEFIEDDIRLRRN